MTISAYACRGCAFATQQEACEAMEIEKASADRAGDLMLFYCDEGHWHYREEWR